MLRIPHCVDNQLTDGGEVVSLMRQPRSCPFGKTKFSILIHKHIIAYHFSVKENPSTTSAFVNA
jgi:hypothetical protein